MKIHFVASSLGGGGAERVLALLADEFSERDHQVSIITFNTGEFYSLKPSIKRVKLHGGFKFNHTIRSFVNLFRYYNKKSNRPDVSIAFMPRMSLISILICRFYRIKVIGCEHNNHLREVPNWTKFAWNYIYRFANTITVLTEFDKPFFESKKAKVVVMPNPCTFKVVDKPLKREKVILAVGGLDRIYHKGFDNLLDLLPKVLNQNPDWKLKIAGGGDQGLKILTERAKENKIYNQVEFLGFITNVDEVMRKSEIFVLPSRYEGLPMVLLEAMSQGMACIAYDCKTGPSDIITDQVNGLLIEDQNQDKMVDGLNELILNKSLRITLQQNALKSLEKYSMENIMKYWQVIFNEIIDEK